MAQKRRKNIFRFAKNIFSQILLRKILFFLCFAKKKLFFSLREKNRALRARDERSEERARAQTPSACPARDARGVRTAAAGGSARPLTARHQPRSRHKLRLPSHKPSLPPPYHAARSAIIKKNSDGVYLKFSSKILKSLCIVFLRKTKSSL